MKMKASEIGAFSNKRSRSIMNHHFLFVFRRITHILKAE